MKNNNGKVAIAIVAMFVVALSVVGFTYAYFTASVQGNEKNNESVKVTAGTMVVSYDMGDKITANNIIPGWKNDGKTFYDPVYSIQKDANNISRITAVSIDDFGTGEGKLAAEPSVGNISTLEEDAVKTLLAPYGLRDAVTFNVANTGSREAYYSVALTAMENNLSHDANTEDDVEVYDDRVNLVYSVYVSNTEDGEYVLDTTLGTNGVIPFGTAATSSIYARVALPVGEARYYKIIFHYKEANVNQTASDNNPNAFRATVTVDGLEEQVVDQNNTTPETTTTAAGN